MKEKDVDDVVEEQILTIKLRAKDSNKKLMKYKLKFTNSVNDDDDILMLNDVIMIMYIEIKRLKCAYQISTDFSEQFQSGSVSGFGFGLLGYMIKQLVMNKMEQPTLPLSGEAIYLTSLYVSDQPFGLGVASKEPFGLGVASEELCFYKRSFKHNAFTVDKDHEEKEEYTTPLARVYRQGLPEWTSDVTNYKSKDFPQQDLAIRCNLHRYMALPVFDIAR
uniref:NIN-like protein n=1 Tax=Tanacetum cinerariifolium TaxID=118510 RepID=A0A699HID1_TANCI|nr:NIN-like protein [Tanacetum cinerariifolium]